MAKANDVHSVASAGLMEYPEMTQLPSARTCGTTTSSAEPNRSKLLKNVTTTYSPSSSPPGTFVVYSALSSFRPCNFAYLPAVTTYFRLPLVFIYGGFLRRSQLTGRVAELALVEKGEPIGGSSCAGKLLFF